MTNLRIVTEGNPFGTDCGLRILTTLMLGILIAAPAVAQMSAEELRREQIETIEALKATENISGGSSKFFGDLGRRTGWLFNYGSPFSTTYTGGDNGTDRNSTAADANDHSYDYEVKPFVTISSADRKAKFYTRLTSKYTEAKKNTISIRGNNFIQPTVDMMYWEKSFAGKGTRAGVKNKFVIGRQFVQVGRGIAYAGTADGVFFEQTGLAQRKGEWKAFALKQNPSDDNIDASSSGFGRTSRFFYGIRGKYGFNPMVKASLYAVHTNDRNKTESTVDALTKHGFQPEYYGVVSEGKIKGVQYWGEYIIERGQTYSGTDSGTAASQRVDLKGSALVTGLRYYFDGDLKPTLYGEYMTGSGDPDALTSSNSSNGGSSTRSKDSRFNSFGGVSAGFALSPTLTNMKIYKVGFSVKPFARSPHRILQDFSAQPEYYLYRRRTGALGAAGNDAVVSNQSPTSNKIGDEFDFGVSWRLMSDFTYQLRYGHFNPGSAYGATTSAETYWRFKVSIDL